MSDADRETLRAALDPKSVAVIGASDTVNKIGGRARGNVTDAVGRLRAARLSLPDHEEKQREQSQGHP